MGSLPMPSQQDAHKMMQGNGYNSQWNGPVPHLYQQYQYCAQNSSYNFNNSFYQNYVSNSQKQFAIKFRNDGGFSTATTAALGGDSLGQASERANQGGGRMAAIQVQSSQQLSYRDQQIHRVAPEFNQSQQQQIELSPDFQQNSSETKNVGGVELKNVQVSTFHENLPDKPPSLQNSSPNFKAAFDLANMAAQTRSNNAPPMQNLFQTVDNDQYGQPQYQLQLDQ